MDNQKIPLSVMVMTKNEEKNLVDCLESVSWAKDIIVLDDCSTDQTKEIAQRYTSHIVERKLDIEGRHRNYGYSLAKENWILSLDADERVTPELAEEIKKIVTDNSVSLTGFSIPIRNYLGTYWIQHGGWYPASKLRLFKKGTFRYQEDEVHPLAIGDDNWGYCKGDILHYSYKNIEDFVHKLNNLSSREAIKWIRTERTMTLGHALWRTIDRFFRTYFIKKGYKDGLIGFMVAIFASLYQILSYAKYWEMKKNGIPE
ncbi:MAG: glycosyltransferase family 2 protein [Deltaproteobacteria bacterium]|nr:glycosyltransferase family 2 protein [Deltaproteobacteria bacterium]